MTTRIIDQAELAVRIAEALNNAPRPAGMSGSDGMAQIMAKNAKMGFRYLEAAQAACAYLSECEKVELHALPSNSFPVRVL